MKTRSPFLHAGLIAPVANLDSIRAVLAAGLLCFVLPIWSAAGAADPDAHDFACYSCHLAQEIDAGNASQLVADEAELCQGCHQNAVAASHPIGIRPAMEIPGEFPLSADGEITCSTCHRVHDTAPGKLRSALEGQEFCEACHQQSFFSGMKDGGVSLMAFGHLDAGASLSGNIDNFSIQCMACHDKAADPVGGQASGVGSDPAMARRNHPIGSRYADSIDFGSYRPGTGLPDAILLPDGKLSCVSCHVGYSDRHGALVMDNRADRLCLTCHEL